MNKDPKTNLQKIDSRFHKHSYVKIIVANIVLDIILIKTIL